MTAVPLLAAKLLIPPYHRASVRRSRLDNVLQNGSDRWLTLISAPAGFGKTTLVSGWLTTQDRPAVWLTLDTGDNDPIRFLKYFIAALQQVNETAGKRMAHLLEDTHLPPIDMLATLLIADLITFQPVCLVLDDYHLIHERTVHDFVLFWLEHRPPHIHVMVLTRHDPPFPLAKWRVRGELNEVREDHLRFTHDEIIQFLQAGQGLTLSAELVETLALRTEGWIASLQLAALMLAHQPDPDRFIATFSGSHRFVVDYLTEEVLHWLSAERREFLRQTSILDRFTADLCDAVTGWTDGQAHLAWLEDANLFLSPLDSQRHWYRYHPLFAEAMRTTLHSAELALLHSRAAAWFKQQGLMDQAIQHALIAARVSGDLGELDPLVSSVAEEMIHVGRLQTVRAWMGAFPDDYIRSRGPLAMIMGWTLALGSQVALADDYARLAEAAFRQSTDEAAGLGKSLVLRSVIAIASNRASDGLRFAEEGLTLLTDQHPYWRTIAHWAIGNAQEFLGEHITKAVESFSRAARVPDGRDQRVFTVVSESSLASALYFQGQRRQALQVCEAALQRIVQNNGQVVPMAANLLARRGILSYDANDLEAARHDLEQAVMLSQQSGLESQIIMCKALHTCVQFALGDHEASIQTLQSLQQRSHQSGYYDTSWFTAWEIHAQLRRGDHEAARRWMATSGIGLDLAFHFTHAEAYLTYGRVLVADARPEEAIAWLEHVARQFEKRGLNRWLLTAEIVLALAYWDHGDQPAALGSLARAVDFAALQGFYRPFLDEDARLLGLLPHLQPSAPVFIDTLLNFSGPAAPGKQALPEPLSERELDVLRLMAEGCSNQQIALKLYITVGTVKRHVHNILDKLNVPNRVAAVLRVQELELL